MVGKGVPTAVGFVGGLLVVLGAGSALRRALAGTGGTFSSTALFGPAAVAVFAGVLGLMVLFFSRPRILWWRGRLLFNGLILIVVGAVLLIVVPLGLLIEIGAVLAILAGAIFAIESFAPRRSLFRRSWF